MTHVLVTGGAEFIGSHSAIGLLEHGYTVLKGYESLAGVSPGDSLAVMKLLSD